MSTILNDFLKFLHIKKRSSKNEKFTLRGSQTENLRRKTYHRPLGFSKNDENLSFLLAPPSAETGMDTNRYHLAIHSFSASSTRDGESESNNPTIQKDQKKWNTGQTFGDHQIGEPKQAGPNFGRRGQSLRLPQRHRTAAELNGTENLHNHRRKLLPSHQSFTTTTTHIQQQQQQQLPARKSQTPTPSRRQRAANNFLVVAGNNRNAEGDYSDWMEWNGGNDDQQQKWMSFNNKNGNTNSKFRQQHDHDNKLLLLLKNDEKPVAEEENPSNNLQNPSKVLSTARTTTGTGSKEETTENNNHHLWKGVVFGRKYNSRTGYFPQSAVKLIDKQATMQRSTTGGVGQPARRTAKKVNVPQIPPLLANRLASKQQQQPEESSSPALCTTFKGDQSAATTPLVFRTTKNIGGLRGMTSSFSSASNDGQSSKHIYPTSMIIGQSSAAVTNNNNNNNNNTNKLRSLSPNKHRNSTGSSLSNTSSGFESMRSNAQSSSLQQNTSTGHVLPHFLPSSIMMETSYSSNCSSSVSTRNGGPLPSDGMTQSKQQQQQQDQESTTSTTSSTSSSSSTAESGSLDAAGGVGRITAGAAGGGLLLDESGYASNSQINRLSSNSGVGVSKSGDRMLLAWLHELEFDEYGALFAEAGYDMSTVSRMTPEDLTAIGITKPEHRRQLTAEIHRLKIINDLPNFEPECGGLREWLNQLNMSEYADLFTREGYRSVSQVMQLTWEDFEDFGISKLGHLKKLELAIQKIKQSQLLFPRLYVSSSAAKRVVACPDPMLQRRERVSTFLPGWTKVDRLPDQDHLSTARFSDVERNKKESSSFSSHRQRNTPSPHPAINSFKVAAPSAQLERYANDNENILMMKNGQSSFSTTATPTNLILTHAAAIHSNKSNKMHKNSPTSASSSQMPPPIPGTTTSSLHEMNTTTSPSTTRPSRPPAVPIVTVYPQSRFNHHQSQSQSHQSGRSRNDNMMIRRPAASGGVWRRSTSVERPPSSSSTISILLNDSKPRPTMIEQQRDWSPSLKGERRDGRIPTRNLPTRSPSSSAVLPFLPNNNSSSGTSTNISLLRRDDNRDHHQDHQDISGGRISRRNAPPKPPLLFNRRRQHSQDGGLMNNRASLVTSSTDSCIGMTPTASFECLAPTPVIRCEESLRNLRSLMSTSPYYTNPIPRRKFPSNNNNNYNNFPVNTSSFSSRIDGKHLSFGGTVNHNNQMTSSTETLLPSCSTTTTTTATTVPFDTSHHQKTAKTATNSSNSILKSPSAELTIPTSDYFSKSNKLDSKLDGVEGQCHHVPETIDRQSHPHPEVLNDIGHMLQNLAQELDSILVSPPV